jgi:cell division protein FtsL
VKKEMKLTLDIKTLIAIAGIIAMLGGFYYSTQHRLNSLELQIEDVSQKIDAQSGELKQIKKQIRRQGNNR